MSNIKALDKLRKYAEVHWEPWDASRERLNESLDDIEQEIAERYIELPVDADGVPIRAGDLIEFGEKGERLEVTHFGWTRHGDPTIAYRRPNGTLDCSCIGAECRHVKPRTLEDVLRECCNEWNEHCGDDWESGVYAKYAEEIRGMMA